MTKIILAFSGGLDTSFCIPYLQEKGYEVVTATVNTGGFSPDEMELIKKTAYDLGAVNHYEVDAQTQLYDQFASYVIKANYQKGGVYPACVGPERIVIAQEMAKIADQESTTCIAHGSTGAGNDQVRFDLALKALIPNCTIITPIRENGFSRSEEAEYLEKHGHMVDASVKDYSINVGLLGTTIGGKETLDTKELLPESSFPKVQPLDKTPDTAQQIDIMFNQGLPTALDGEDMDGVSLIQKLNEIAETHGFGKDYHTGTTIIGIKGRIGFEAPALKTLIKAHTELEKLVLTSKQLFWKSTLGNLYGDLIHEGQYFDPIVSNIESFLDSANENVTGKVTVEFYKGHMTIKAIDSQYSLLNSKLGTYGEENAAWNGQDAASFCKMYGLEGVNAHITKQTATHNTTISN
jgi:argininosuccinate synthase